MRDIVDDPQFRSLQEEGSKWAVLTHHGVLIAPTVEDAVLRLDIANTSGANWHGELLYAPFPVQAGEDLSLSFSARATHPFSYSVWLGQRDSPYQSLVSAENHFGEKLMTSQWQTFTHAWRPVLAEKSARLNFVLGQIDNMVEIKDIKLTRAV